MYRTCQTVDSWRHSIFLDTTGSIVYDVYIYVL